jgi:putative transposase
MRLIDEEFTRHPFYGSRRLTHYLKKLGYQINRKRVKGLMKKMGISAIYPKPNLSVPNIGHKKFPYLLRDLPITRPNQVWSADITYIRMQSGFMYLVAVIDWFSRYVLSWKLSNTLDSYFCVEALKEALSKGVPPEIFNTDQGVQFTSNDFINCLQEIDIRISMDGKGRALDNVFIERLWRSVKYEYVYLHEHKMVPDLYKGLSKYFFFYNKERPHMSLNYSVPHDIHFQLH